MQDYTRGDDHFQTTVVAPAFAGLSRIEQHRMVYGVFGDEIGSRSTPCPLKTRER